MSLRALSLKPVNKSKSNTKLAEKAVFKSSDQPLYANSARESVYRYYKSSTQDYLKYYQTGWHQDMHYGFQRGLPKGGNPTENLVRYMAEFAQVKKDDFVLDCGCGVGGSSLWLASHIGCKCSGLNLMELQLKLARQYTLTRGQQARCIFINGDFTQLPIKPNSYDVIWAIESSCHAPDKARWVKDMFSILKPGGRLIVADGFCAEGVNGTSGSSSFSPYNKFLKGWAVPNLASPQSFLSYFNNAGFSSVRSEDISPDIAPHALMIFRFGLIFIPLRWVLLKLSLTSPEKYGNAVATYYQYLTFRKALWSYQIFCGVK